LKSLSDGNNRHLNRHLRARCQELQDVQLWYREHHLPVWYVREQGLLQLQTPKRHTLRVATLAEGAALARERQPILVLARTTAHAGEAVLEDTAGEILLDHLGDDRPPVSVTVGEPLVATLASSLGSASHRRMDKSLAFL
jgi:hypothetical protein